MKTPEDKQTLRFGPGELCRMDPALLTHASSLHASGRLVKGAVLTILVGTTAYGFVFGVWRDPWQGLFSAVKMPLLFLLTVLASAMANTMLAQVMGARLSFRQVCLCMLVGMAVAAALLGAVSPVFLFLIVQLPSPGNACLGMAFDAPAVQPMATVYWWLLIFHVATIGCAGIVGNLRLYRLLVHLVGKRRLVVMLMAAWIAVSGFVGCEISWLLSPFLCQPTEPPHIVSRGYFEENFYERMWRAAKACAKSQRMEVST